MKKLKSVGLGLALVLSLATSVIGCGSAGETTKDTASEKTVESKVEATSGGEAEIKKAATEENNSEQETEKQQVTIRVADMSAWNNAYFEYGDEKDLLDTFFENDKYDISFEITSFANGPAEIEAFAAGELDFASMGSMPATTGASSDFGFKIVAIVDKSEHIGSLVALADSGIESIEDLKGKKVGTIFGGTLHYYTGRFLESVGLSYDDIDFINSGNETPSSLRAGEIDAGAIGNNVAVDLVNEGTVVLLADSVEGVIGFSEVCISEKIINEYDGLAPILLRGYDNLYQYIDANKEDYVTYLHDLTGAETDGILAVWDYGERKVQSLEDPIIHKNAEELLVWMQEQDMVENTEVTFDELVDYSVAQEAGY